MPVISKKITTRGESYERFLKRNERKETRMATMLKKKDQDPKAAKADKKAKSKDEVPKGRVPGLPVPQVDRDGDRYGLTLGLRLNHTFAHVLAENENPKKGRKTDDELMEFLVKEFENRENKAILYNIREIRWRYNVGKLTLDPDTKEPVPPEIQSLKYDAEGKPFQKATSKKTGMSPEEKAMSIEKRKDLERARREKEDELIEGLEEKIVLKKELNAARRHSWEEKNGSLEDVKAVEEAKPKKKLKKA